MSYRTRLHERIAKRRPGFAGALGFILAISFYLAASGLIWLLQLRIGLWLLEKLGWL